MLQKKLVTGLFWVLFLNLIIKPFWILGIEVGVQNAVGTEAYGFYFAVFNLAYIFNILLDVGITNFNTRNIAQSPQLIRKHLSGILTIKLLLFVLYVVVTYTVGMLLGYSSSQFKLLAILTFNQFLNSFILYLRSNFQGLLMFRWDSVISILDRLVMILICGCMLWGPFQSQFTIFTFACTQTVAYLVSAALALILLTRRTGLCRLRLNRLFSLAILKQSFPFAVLVLLMATYNRIDPLLLQQLLPGSLANTEVGIYAEAFRLLDALTTVTYLVSVPLLPVYARLTKSVSNTEELNAVTQMAFSLTMVFSITSAVTLWHLANPLMELLYNEHATRSAQVFSILVFGIIPIGVTYIFGTLLTAAGRLKQLNLMAVGALLANVGVNLVLIPRHGAMGSACASLVTQSLMALGQMILALHLFNIKITSNYVLRLTAFTLFVVAANLLLPTFTWWVTLLIVGMASLALAFLLKLIDIKQIVRTLKTDN